MEDVPKTGTRISPRETSICERFRLFREESRIPRTLFAAEIGVPGERLASYEYCRAPLPYDLFKATAVKYGLSWRWLATGDGYSHSIRLFDDSAFSEAILPKAIFSEIYDLHLAQDDSRLFDELTGEYDYRMSQLELLMAKIADLYPGKNAPRRLLIAIADEADQITKECNTNHASAALFMKKFGKDAVDNVTQVVNVDDVESIISNLIHRLKLACGPRGKKAELARFLGVPLPSISRWLARHRAPSADTTLRMLEWVTAEEAKQTKSPGSVDARPEPKTQKKTPYHEKSTPSPK